MLHKELSSATYAFICKSTTFRRFSKDFENKSSKSNEFLAFQLDKVPLEMPKN